MSAGAETRAFWRWLARAGLGGARVLMGFGLGLLAILLSAYGVFRAEETGNAELAALGGVSLLLVARLFERVHGNKTGRLENLELGTLFVGATFAVVEVTGGPSGLLYPLVYTLVAFLVAFHSLGEGLYFLTLVLGAEALLTAVQPGGSWKLFASHASFNVLFGLLSALFLRSEALQRKSRMQREVGDFLHSIEQEAQDFRLTSGLSHSRDLSLEEVKQRRRVGSVHAIQESLYNVLGVAERALVPHTVALLWLDATDRFLKVKELRSASDRVTEKPIAAGEGFLGAITKRKEPLVLSSLKPGQSGLCYYDSPETVTDFVGVPVLDDGFLRGALVADRKDGRHFDDADVAVLQTLADEIVRAVQVERIFGEMDRDKFQKERFYEASREFNKALTVEQVAQQAINAAKRVAQPELASVCVATEKEGRMRVCAVDWAAHPEAQELVGEEFVAEEGLVGAAIKARHPLPLGTARAASQHILGPSLSLEVAAVKVVPLISRERGVGALIVGSSKDDFLSASTLDMIKVIGDHAAIAMANAQIYERMERMATTDGLTGLVNHRHFQELYDAALARVERYGRKLSVILTDIDHFKSVNDTYGHPVGDQVLRRVAVVLGQSARRTDIVARYGGEEFAVLMEDTDRTGARMIAERIRTSVEAETFRCEQGSFRTTISLGVATYPEDATQKSKLTSCADQSLYAAKHGGRNRTVTYDSIRSRREVSQSA